MSGVRRPLTVAMLFASVFGAMRTGVSAPNTVHGGTGGASMAQPSPGYGYPPDVWGMSAACRRMAFKNRGRAKHAKGN